jgi:hypothetical protein
LAGVVNLFIIKGDSSIAFEMFVTNKKAQKNWAFEG